MWSHSDVVWIYIVLKTLQIVIGKILFLMYLQVLQHIPLYHPALKGPSVELDNTFYAHRTLCKPQNTMQGDRAVILSTRLFRQSCECGLFKNSKCTWLPIIII